MAHIRRYRLFALFESASLLREANKDPVQFEVSIGNFGNLLDENSPLCCSATASCYSMPLRNISPLGGCVAGATGTSGAPPGGGGASVAPSAGSTDGGGGGGSRGGGSGSGGGKVKGQQPHGYAFLPWTLSVNKPLCVFDSCWEDVGYRIEVLNAILNIIARLVLDFLFPNWFKFKAEPLKFNHLINS